jgi:hypothetical protein
MNKNFDNKQNQECVLPGKHLGGHPPEDAPEETSTKTLKDTPEDNLGILQSVL